MELPESGCPQPLGPKLQKFLLDSELGTNFLFGRGIQIQDMALLLDDGEFEIPLGGRVESLFSRRGPDFVHLDHVAGTRITFGNQQQ